MPGFSWVNKDPHVNFVNTWQKRADWASRLMTRGKAAGSTRHSGSVPRTTTRNAHNDIRFLPLKGIKTTASVFAINLKKTYHQLVASLLDILRLHSVAR